MTLLSASSPATAIPRTADETLSELVDQRVASWSGDDSPGGALCIWRDGEPLLFKAFGMADVEAERPNTLETPFYVASVSKTFTAYCAMHAARAGDLKLDASLLEHFPELSEAHGGATLRQAMHHTSGVIDVYDAVIAGDLSLDVLSSNERALELMGRFDGPSFEPGSRFLYCNSGFVLLAEALHRATGKTLQEYAREHVLEPHGMESAYYLGEEGSEAAAVSYHRTSDAWSRLSIKSRLHGPGGLFASVNDLSSFAAGLRSELADGRGADLLETLPGATHPRLGAYAAGWMLTTVQGLRAQRHFGGGFGYSADLLRFPDQEVTIITLSNAGDLSASELSESLATLVLSEEIEAVEVATPNAFALAAEDVARFGRLWRSNRTDEVFILSPKRPGFVIAALGDLKLHLLPVSRTRLEAVDSQVPFALELEGESLVLHCGDRAAEELRRLPFPPADLPPATDFAGEYVSDVLESVIKLEPGPRGFLSLEQNSPLLELPPFMPLGRDLYFCDKGARIDFHRDDDGRVTGLTMHANRAWGLEFERLD